MKKYLKRKLEKKTFYGRAGQAGQLDEVKQATFFFLFFGLIETLGCFKIQ